MLTSFPTVTCAGTRAAAASTMKHPIHVARHFTPPPPFLLQHFHLRRRPEFLVQPRPQLLGLQVLQLLAQRIFYVLEFLHAGRVMGDETHDRQGLIHLDQATHLPGLQGQRRGHHLRRQFVAIHGLVLAHHHPVVIFRNLFRQQTELFVIPGGLGLLQRILRPFAGVFQLLGRGFFRRQYRNRLEGKRFRQPERRGILLVVSLRLGQGNAGLVFHFDGQQLVNQQRTPDFLPQHLLRALAFPGHKSLVVVGTLELLPELHHGVIQFCRRHRHPPPLGFLVDQLLKHNHLQRALANVLFHRLGKSAVVLPRIGKNREHLAQQIAVRQHRSVHPGHRLLRGNRRCVCTRGCRSGRRLMRNRHLPLRRRPHARQHHRYQRLLHFSFCPHRFFASLLLCFFTSLLRCFFTSVFLSTRKVGGETSSPQFMNNPS